MIKRLIFVSFFFYCAPGFSAMDVQFGTGINISNVSFGDEKQEKFDSTGFKKEPRYGFNLGILFGVPITEMFGLDLGLFFETRGYVFKLEDPGDSLLNLPPEKFEGVEKINHLRFPILARGLFELGPGRISAAAGMEFGLVLVGNLDVQEELALGSISIQTDTTYKFENLRRLETGIAFQLAYEIPIGRNAIVVGGGYSWALTPQGAEDPNDPTPLTDKDAIFNNNIKIFVRFKIDN